MYRVYVERAFEMAAYRVYLFEESSGGHRRVRTRGGHWVEFNESQRMDPLEHAFAVIPDGAAHELLGELSRVLGAVEHPEQLRKDYEHERGRVDRMMDYLMRRK